MSGRENQAHNTPSKGLILLYPSCHKRLMNIFVGVCLIFSSGTPEDLYSDSNKLVPLPLLCELVTV